MTTLAATRTRKVWSLPTVRKLAGGSSAPVAATGPSVRHREEDDQDIADERDRVEEVERLKRAQMLRGADDQARDR
jgi:hypothetical protein